MMKRKENKYPKNLYSFAQRAGSFNCSSNLTEDTEFILSEFIYRTSLEICDICISTLYFETRHANKRVANVKNIYNQPTLRWNNILIYFLQCYGIFHDYMGLICSFYKHF